MPSSNFRIAQIDTFVSSSVVTELGNRKSEATGSSGHNLYRAWGVMTPYGAVTSGSVNLLDGGSLKLEYLIPGEVYTIYPTSIAVSTGTALVLS
jgi:hypothetical protein